MHNTEKINSFCLLVHHHNYYNWKFHKRVNINSKVKHVLTDKIKRCWQKYRFSNVFKPVYNGHRH